ncbi:MAG: NUDIX domain-containing protein [Caldilineaceae bacterium]|nr:NUDIX domain-containing protein [Caldilineaceae bacterium]
MPRPMQANEQGVREPGRRRHQAIPRTLIFVTSTHPDTGSQEVLLIKGAPTKRLWANRYNGLGGHVEAHEDVLAAAQRELAEETGLTPHLISNLTLRGVITIDTGVDEQGPRPGVLVFVFVAQSEQRSVHVSREGRPEWLPVDALAEFPLVDDLYEVIPRALGDGPIFFGHYSPQPDGRLAYRFHDSPV